MNEEGIRLQSLPPSLTLEAFELISKAQNHKYPNIFTSPNAQSRNGICFDCHFNNCDECAPSVANPTLPNDNPDGPGYPHACIQRAQTRRESRITTQEIILARELVGCGIAGAGVGGAVCIGTVWFPPLGAAAGIAGFCITTGGCGFLSFVQYRSEVATIEAEYQQDRASCF